MDIYLNKETHALFNLFHQHGYQAYLVGGFVRDALLGRESDDYDIATDAPIREIVTWFSEDQIQQSFTSFKRVDIQINFTCFQITSFRKDENFKNHRYPQKVTSVSSAKMDSLRRDFTFNALYYHPATGLLDFHSGYDDLMHHQLKTIKDPYQCFEEDALRILRAIRFMSHYDFSCDKNTLQAMDLYASNLEKLKHNRLVKNEYILFTAGKYKDKVIKFLPSKLRFTLTQIKESINNENN